MLFLAMNVILHYFLSFFTAPLMADFNHLSKPTIRELAKHTEAVKLKFQEFASYNINIITGSMPFIENEHTM
jgi:hypothetical protein